MNRLISKYIKPLSLATAAVALLTQCSSVPERASSPSVGDTSGERHALPIDRSQGSANEWLSQAQAAKNEAMQQAALIEAALAFQTQSQWQQSAAVLAFIDSRKLLPNSLPQFQFAQARWLAHQQQWQAAIDKLQPVAEQFQQRQQRLYALNELASYYAQVNQNWQATITQIEAEQYNGAASLEDSARSIWQYASHVSADQLPPARPYNHRVAGWWRLLQSLHQYPQSGKALNTALLRWQSSYSDHLANQLVEPWVQQQWPAVKHVAVLLPLSGRYQTQGQAIRDGLIAAASWQQVRLTFIDTALTTLAEQQQQVLAAGGQHIIGPLLKENVEAWLQQPLVGPTQLLLNEVNASQQAVLHDGLLQFALAPEEEASQAADRVFALSTRSPIVMAADTNSGQRQINSFRQRWQQLSERAVDVGTYSERSGMQEMVERKLGVSASKERIRQVKIAAGKIIVDEQERSRADVDAVYLPGSLQHVRLLKPFIDVNLSPFAPPLKVYASSATHQRSNHNGDNDLAGIRFSESPALIGNHPLSEHVDQWLGLRKDASLSDARLFAMGIDSLDLLSRAEIIKRTPGIEVDGLTGTLSMVLNRVRRQLGWAEFTRAGLRPLGSIRE